MLATTVSSEHLILRPTRTTPLPVHPITIVTQERTTLMYVLTRNTRAEKA